MCLRTIHSCQFHRASPPADINTQLVTKTIMLLPRSGEYPLQIQDSYPPERKVSVVAFVNQIQIKVHVPQTVMNYPFSPTTPSRLRMWFRKRESQNLHLTL